MPAVHLRPWAVRQRRVKIITFRDYLNIITVVPGIVFEQINCKNFAFLADDDTKLRNIESIRLSPGLCLHHFSLEPPRFGDIALSAEIHGVRRPPMKRLNYYARSIPIQSARIEQAAIENGTVSTERNDLRFLSRSRAPRALRSLSKQKLEMKISFAQKRLIRDFLFVRYFSLSFQMLINLFLNNIIYRVCRSIAASAE